MIDPDLTLVRDAVHAMPMAQTLGLSVEVLTRGHAELHVPIAEALTFAPGRWQASAVDADGERLCGTWLGTARNIDLTRLAP